MAQGRVRVLNEVNKEGQGGWHLCFQYCHYEYGDGTEDEKGYRFIWRRPDGSLQGARGQARIPSVADIHELIVKARLAGWGDLLGESASNNIGEEKTIMTNTDKAFLIKELEMKQTLYSQIIINAKRGDYSHNEHAFWEDIINFVKSLKALIPFIKGKVFLSPELSTVPEPVIAVDMNLGIVKSFIMNNGAKYENYIASLIHHLDKISPTST